MSIPVHQLRRAAFVTASASHLGWLAWQVSTDLAVNAGAFTYGLDDSYIHLAMARNIAQSGTYGVSPGIFASASSSPLWTWTLGLLMALMPASTVLWAPMVAGALAGLGSLWFIVHALTRALGTTSRTQALAVLAVAALLPPMLGLPTLTMHGMEHGLHMVLTQWLAVATAQFLLTPGRGGALLLLSFLMPLVRFESLAPVLAAAGVVAAARRWRLGLALLAMAGLGMVAQGAYSLAHGEHFFPNSVLVKAWIHTHAATGMGEIHVGAVTGPTVAVAPPSAVERVVHFISHIIGRWGANLGYSALLLWVFIGCMVLAAYQAGRRTLTRDGVGVLTVCLVTYFAQTAMVSGGPDFQRYQSYLIGLGLTGLAYLGGPSLLKVALSARASRWQSFAAAAGVAVVAVLAVPAMQHEASVGASTAGVRGHFAVARAIAHIYPTGTVMIEDLGAVVWQRQAPVVDVFGLASADVADRLLHGQNDAAGVDAIARAHQIPAAFVRPLTLPAGPRRGAGTRPDSWALAGCLARSTNQPMEICAYATSAAELPHLTQGLRQAAAADPVGLTLVEPGDPALANLP